MRFVLAGLLLVHGLAHIVGFLVPWKLAKLEERAEPVHEQALFFRGRRT